MCTCLSLTCCSCRADANNHPSKLPVRANVIKNARATQQPNAYKCPTGASQTPWSTSRHMLGHAGVKSCAQSPCNNEMKGSARSVHYKKDSTGLARKLKLAQPGKPENERWAYRERTVDSRRKGKGKHSIAVCFDAPRNCQLLFNAHSRQVQCGRAWPLSGTKRHARLNMRV